MKLPVITIIALSCFFGGAAKALSDDLGTELRKSGWESMIGTWVDPETDGKKHQLTFAWRYSNHVIEITNREGEQETTGLMGRNPKSGEVFYVGADNQGGSSLGSWTIENGEAVLRMGFVSGAGEEGGLEVRHRREGDDTMFVTVVLPEPVTFQLVRRKTK